MISNITGNKVIDKCHPPGSELKHEYATFTQDQCLKTCETRMITGCEFRDVSHAECFLHTKYIIDAQVHRLPHGTHTCWKFERGINISCNQKPTERIQFI